VSIIESGALLAALVLLGSVSVPSNAGGSKPKERDEWLSVRGNPRLDARSPGKGRITDPGILWKQFVGGYDTFIEIAPGAENATTSVPADTITKKSIEVLSDDRWGLTPPITLIAGSSQPWWRDTCTVYADILPDSPGLEKVSFESGFNKPTVDGQWAKCIGTLSKWDGSAWQEVWRTDEIDLMFSALPIVGDFDRDGRLEIAALPWKDILIYDALTGKLKDRCTFTEGRSYGFFGVYDLDGDGLSEFVVMSDYCKHINVLGYRDGKLGVFWTDDIELGFDNPQKVLRVNPNSVADVDGDGKPEMMVCLYNGTGDERWHVSIRDPMTGKTKLDFVDEYLNGVVDIDGDGVYELLTTRAKGQGVPGIGSILCRKIRNGVADVLWKEDGAGWESWDRPLSRNTNSGANLGTRDVLARSFDNVTYVAITSRDSDDPNSERISIRKWESGGMTEVSSAAGPGIRALGIDSSGHALLRFTNVGKAKASVATKSGGVKLHASTLRGVPNGTVTVAWGRHARRPVIAAMGPYEHEQIVTFHPPCSNGAESVVRRVHLRGESVHWPYIVIGPSMADIFGDGRRQLIGATSSPSGCGRIVVCDLEGREIWHHDFPDIPGGPPMWNVGAVILWQTGHLTSREHKDVIVSVRRSIMHSEETYALSGLNGSMLWHRDHQISQRGVGGTHFAIVDIDGDGLEDVVSFWPSIYYALKGTTGNDIVARDMFWPGQLAQNIYWGVPIAVTLQDGKPGLVYASSNRVMAGLIRADGGLAWFDALNFGPDGYPALGDFTGGGALEMIVTGTGEKPEVRCYDVNTGKIRWTMPSPAGRQPSGSASADLNSDGRDEAVFTYGSKVYCIGSSEDGKSGKVLWSIDAGNIVGAPAIADIDGSGFVSIIVVDQGGTVHAIGQKD